MLGEDTGATTEKMIRAEGTESGIQCAVEESTHEVVGSLLNITKADLKDTTVTVTHGEINVLDVTHVHCEEQIDRTTEAEDYMLNACPSTKPGAEPATVAAEKAVEKRELHQITPFTEIQSMKSNEETEFVKSFEAISGPVKLQPLQVQQVIEVDISKMTPGIEVVKERTEYEAGNKEEKSEQTVVDVASIGEGTNATSEEITFLPRHSHQTQSDLEPFIGDNKTSGTAVLGKSHDVKLCSSEARAESKQISTHRSKALHKKESSQAVDKPENEEHQKLRIELEKKWEVVNIENDANGACSSEIIQQVDVMTEKVLREKENVVVLGEDVKTGGENIISKEICQERPSEEETLVHSDVEQTEGWENESSIEVLPPQKQTEIADDVEKDIAVEANEAGIGNMTMSENVVGGAEESEEIENENLEIAEGTVAKNAAGILELSVTEKEHLEEVQKERHMKETGKDKEEPSHDNAVKSDYRLEQAEQQKSYDTEGLGSTGKHKDEKLHLETQLRRAQRFKGQSVEGELTMRVLRSGTKSVTTISKQSPVPNTNTGKQQEQFAVCSQFGESGIEEKEDVMEFHTGIANANITSVVDIVNVKDTAQEKIPMENIYLEPETTDDHAPKEVEYGSHYETIEDDQKLIAEDSEDPELKGKTIQLSVTKLAEDEVNEQPADIIQGNKLTGNEDVVMAVVMDKPDESSTEGAEGNKDEMVEAGGGDMSKDEDRDSTCAGQDQVELLQKEEPPKDTKNLQEIQDNEEAQIKDTSKPVPGDEQKKLDNQTEPTEEDDSEMAHSTHSTGKHVARQRLNYSTPSRHSPVFKGQPVEGELARRVLRSGTKSVTNIFKQRHVRHVKTVKQQEESAQAVGEPEAEEKEEVMESHTGGGDRDKTESVNIAKEGVSENLITLQDSGLVDTTVEEDNLEPKTTDELELKKLAEKVEDGSLTETTEDGQKIAIEDLEGPEVVRYVGTEVEGNTTKQSVTDPVEERVEEPPAENLQENVQNVVESTSIFTLQTAATVLVDFNKVISKQTIECESKDETSQSLENTVQVLDQTPNIEAEKDENKEVNQTSLIEQNEKGQSTGDEAVTEITELQEEMRVEESVKEILDDQFMVIESSVEGAENTLEACSSKTTHKVDQEVIPSAQEETVQEGSPEEETLLIKSRNLRRRTVKVISTPQRKCKHPQTTGIELTGNEDVVVAVVMDKPDESSTERTEGNKDEMVEALGGDLSKDEDRHSTCAGQGQVGLLQEEEHPKDTKNLQEIQDNEEAQIKDTSKPVPGDEQKKSDNQTEQFEDDSATADNTASTGKQVARQRLNYSTPSRHSPRFKGQSVEGELARRVLRSGTKSVTTIFKQRHVRHVKTVTDPVEKRVEEPPDEMAQKEDEQNVVESTSDFTHRKAEAVLVDFSTVFPKQTSESETAEGLSESMVEVIQVLDKTGNEKEKLIPAEKNLRYETAEEIILEDVAEIQTGKDEQHQKEKQETTSGHLESVQESSPEEETHIITSRNLRQRTVTVICTPQKKPKRLQKAEIEMTENKHIMDITGRCYIEESEKENEMMEAEVSADAERVPESIVTEQQQEINQYQEITDTMKLIINVGESSHADPAEVAGVTEVDPESNAQEQKISESAEEHTTESLIPKSQHSHISMSLEESVTKEEGTKQTEDRVPELMQEKETVNENTSTVQTASQIDVKKSDTHVELSEEEQEQKKQADNGKSESRTQSRQFADQPISTLVTRVLRSTTKQIYSKPSQQYSHRTTAMIQNVENEQAKDKSEGKKKDMVEFQTDITKGDKMEAVLVTVDGATESMEILAVEGMAEEERKVENELDFEKLKDIEVEEDIRAKQCAEQDKLTMEDVVPSGSTTDGEKIPNILFIDIPKDTETEAEGKTPAQLCAEFDKMQDKEPVSDTAHKEDGQYGVDSTSIFTLQKATVVLVDCKTHLDQAADNETIKETSQFQVEKEKEVNADEDKNETSEDKKELEQSVSLVAHEENEHTENNSTETKHKDKEGFNKADVVDGHKSLGEIVVKEQKILEQTADNMFKTSREQVESILTEEKLKDDTVSTFILEESTALQTEKIVFHTTYENQQEVQEIIHDHGETVQETSSEDTPVITFRSLRRRTVTVMSTPTRKFKHVHKAEVQAEIHKESYGNGAVKPPLICMSTEGNMSEKSVEPAHKDVKVSTEREEEEGILGGQDIGEKLLAEIADEGEAILGEFENKEKEAMKSDTAVSVEVGATDVSELGIGEVEHEDDKKMHDCTDRIALEEGLELPTGTPAYIVLETQKQAEGVSDDGILRENTQNTTMIKPAEEKIEEEDSEEEELSITRKLRQRTITFKSPLRRKLKRVCKEAVESQTEKSQPVKEALLGEVSSERKTVEVITAVEEKNEVRVIETNSDDKEDAQIVSGETQNEVVTLPDQSGENIAETDGDKIENITDAAKDKVEGTIEDSDVLIKDNNEIDKNTRPENTDKEEVCSANCEQEHGHQENVLDKAGEQLLQKTYEVEWRILEEPKEVKENEDKGNLSATQEILEEVEEEVGIERRSLKKRTVKATSERKSKRMHKQDQDKNTEQANVNPVTEEETVMEEDNLKAIGEIDNGVQEEKEMFSEKAQDQRKPVGEETYGDTNASKEKDKDGYIQTQVTDLLIVSGEETETKIEDSEKMQVEQENQVESDEHKLAEHNIGNTDKYATTTETVENIKGQTETDPNEKNGKESSEIHFSVDERFTLELDEEDENNCQEQNKMMEMEASDKCEKHTTVKKEEDAAGASSEQRSKKGKKAFLKESKSEVKVTSEADVVKDNEGKNNSPQKRKAKDDPSPRRSKRFATLKTV
ncbi:microtubule-associated protein futsch-like [Hoplias malabaricus]|uniref:microtubule-associated protein futsch-like n=1 Tax=Hoplias malabaricus TaxID=27720 RepID=UPI0034638111